MAWHLGAFEDDNKNYICMLLQPSLAIASARTVVLMPPTTLLTIRASSLARLHTILSLTAFIGALAIASSLHLTKVVRNAIAGWPEEWFPSVSAT